jgi:hypothetical protein
MIDASMTGRYVTSTQMHTYIDALASVEVGLSTVVNVVYAGAPSSRAQGRTSHIFAHNRTILIALGTLGRKSGQAIVSEKTNLRLETKDVALLQAWFTRSLSALRSCSPLKWHQISFRVTAILLKNAFGV